MSTQIYLLLFILLFVIGLGLVLYGFISYKTDKYRLLIKRCSATTDAHISGFDETDKIVKTVRSSTYSKYETIQNKTTEVFYCPFVNFTIDDIEYDIKYYYPIQKRFHNNQLIRIRYNPYNPYEFYISGDKKIKCMSTEAIIAGFFIFAASIYILLSFILGVF